MSMVPVNPKPFLNDLTGTRVLVKLKWGMEYRGTLAAVDAYMNVQLLDSSEYVDGTLAGELGEILIRCNNVMYVTAAPEEGELGEILIRCNNVMYVTAAP